MANNTLKDGILINKNNVAIIANDSSITAGTVRIASDNAVEIGYEQMKTDKKCTIKSAGELYFNNSSKSFGQMYGRTGGVCLNGPGTNTAYGFYINKSGTVKPIMEILSGTDEISNYEINLGVGGSDAVKLLTSNIVRTNDISANTANNGIYYINGSTTRKYAYMNSNNNIIFGSNSFTDSDAYLYARYNSYIRMTATGDSNTNVFYVGKTSLCRNNINCPSGVDFTVGGTSIAFKTITVTRNTTNTSAMSGYVFYYPILNIVQISLQFTMAAMSASKTYTLGTISSTYAPVVTAGLACHLNVTADHSTGIINSEGTLTVYNDKSQSSGKICYVSGIYSTV